MKVLLTGGTGFLGAWTTRRLLAAGCTVRIVDHSTDRTLLEAVAGQGAATVECLAGDVADPQRLAAQAAGCDRIIHLAALLTPACQADPIRGATVNLIGTLAVFEAARQCGIPQVAYASSAGVFGPDSGEVPYPSTQYGAFKLACEASARAYWLDRGIASVGFRPLVVYGPGREVGSTAGVSLACRRAASGVPYTIPYTGMTDLIFVEDVAAALVAAVLRPVSGAHVFNLRGEVADVDQVIASIRTLCPGAALNAAGPPVPVAPHLARHDLSPVLGALPSTTLAEGLARTVAFYRMGAAA
jgi:UDP-glucose 4-epimerase